MKKPYLKINEDETFFYQYFEEGEQPDDFFDIKNTQNFIDPRINKTTFEFYEGATSEQIQLYNQEKETQLYNKRIQDGVNMYSGISAKFRLMKKEGNIDQETHEFIEEIFRPVREEVLAGQWITAKEKVEAIGSQVVGTDLFDMIHGMIVQYIAENYD